MSERALLHLCLYLTQSHLQICHLPPVTVHWNGRILVGHTQSAFLGTVSSTKWKHIAPFTHTPTFTLMHLTSKGKKKRKRKSKTQGRAELVRE